MVAAAIDPTAVFECSWWEYVLDVAGEIVMSPYIDAVSSPMLRSLATGEMMCARDLPIGALFELDRKHCKGPNGWPRAGSDGRAIACKTANYTWHIEGRASNCTMPHDDEHRCWVRHGTVGERLTVDKNGPSCLAGAGSLFMGRYDEWHGFLRDGKLTP